MSLARQSLGDPLERRSAVQIRWVHIYGTSTAAGRKYASNLSTRFAELNPAYPRVLFAQHEYSQADPPVLYYDTVGDLAPRAGITSPPPSSNDTNGVGNMGFALSLGRGLDKARYRYGIMVWARGGAGWRDVMHPAATWPSTGGNNYTRMVAWTKNIIATYGGKIVHRIMAGGELEAETNDGGVLASTITQAMLDITAQMDIDFAAFSDPHCPIIAMRPSNLLNPALYVNNATARTQTENFVTAMGARALLCNTDGLALDSGTHYLSDSNATIGDVGATGDGGLAAQVLYQTGVKLKPVAGFTYQTSNLAPVRRLIIADSSRDPNYLGSIASWLYDFGDGNTSTAQNPTHTYAADGAYAITQTVTDALGQTATFAQVVTVADPTGKFTVDAISGRPLWTGAAEYTAWVNAHGLTARGSALPAPIHGGPLDQASGNVIDIFASGGAKNLTATSGGSAPSYQQTVSDMAAVGITGSGAAATEQATNATYPQVSGADALFLLYEHFDGGGAAFRNLMYWGAAGVNNIEVSANKIRIQTNANNKTSTQDHSGATHSLLKRWSDVTGRQVDDLWTDIEHVVNTAATASGTTVTIGFQLGTEPTKHNWCGYFATWNVCPTDDECRHILHALGEHVTY